MAGEFSHAGVGSELAQAEYHAILGHVLDGQTRGDMIISNAAATGLIRLPLGGGADEVIVVNAAEDDVEWGKRDIRSALRFFIENDMRGLAMLGGGAYSPTVANNDPIDLAFNVELTGTGTFTATPLFLSSWEPNTGGTQSSDAGVIGPRTDTSLDPQFHIRLYFDAPGSFAANDVALAGYKTTVADFDDQNNIIAFRKSGTGNVFGVCDSGGSETTRDTGSSGANHMKLSISVSAATVIFREDGVTIGSNVTTNIYDSNLNTAAGLTNGSAASVRSMSINNIFAWSS